MWEKIANTILRNRLALIIFLVLTTALMLYKATQVQLAYDNPKFIPDDDIDMRAYQEFKKTFGDDGSVMVVGINDAKLRDLDFFNDWYDLTSELNNTKNIKQVLSITNLKELNKKTVLDSFEGEKYEKISLHAGNYVQNRPETQAELDSVFEGLKDLRFYEGLLFKDSSEFSLMAITLEKSILDTKARVPFVFGVKEKIEAVCAKHNIDVHFSGLPFIRTKMSQMIKQELVRFTLVSMVLTALILLFFFRSLPTLAFSLLTVIVGVIWCMGILVLLGYKITMFIGLLPPLIVVIGIANCIYLLNKYHEEYRSHNNKIKALQRVISKVGRAVLFTNLTTAVGFGVFTLTGSKVLQEFGLTAFLAIMAVFLISLILIPVLFSYLPAPKTRHTKHLDYKFLNKLIDKISGIVLNHRKAVYAVSIGIVTLSVLGMTLLKNVGYMVDDISKTDRLYTDLKFFESNVNGVMPFEIVVDTKKPQGVSNVRTLLNIDLLERKLQDFPEFSKPVSISQTMKFLNQAYYDGDPRRYRPPSVLDLGNIMSAVPKSETDEGMINSLVNKDNSKARISVQMADVGSVRIKELQSEVALIADTIFNFRKNTEDIFTDSIIDVSIIDSSTNQLDTTYFSYKNISYTELDSSRKMDLSITGTSIIFLKGNDYLISNLLMSLLIAFVIISLLMASIFKSMRMIVISIIPNLIPLLFTAGIMGFFGVNFKPSTVLVFSVAFGIAVDFSIHFLTKYKMELQNSKTIAEAVSNVQKEISTSMIYTAIILFFGFIIFVFSDFGGTIALGLFTALTLLIALLSNLLLLPSLLLSYDIAKEKRS
ncbi:efflux RND transporter permease subunit [Bacteroidia bacterium]|nr:efflux RND transporter permease subunit [Bacteroidia bacterium]MDC1394978.1 efflux RND transporter permease subunit [Bacteroidia bacterium]